MESSIVVNARSKTAKRRTGEGTASAIKLHKMEDWQMFRVFDSKAETEESDSEEERIFEAAVLGGAGNANNNKEDGEKLPPKAEKKAAKGKTVGNQAKDHVSKGALKIVDADSLLQQLIENNVTATYAEAMVKDMAKPIEELKAAMQELQSSIGKVPEDLGKKTPAAVQRLAKTGASGKFLSNVKRDMQRAAVPHLHHVKIALRNKAGDNVVPTAVPIIAPHELVPWLISNELLVLDDTAATKFWEHHSAVATPGVSNCRNFKDGFTVHPICIYGDEAEYTQTKQKILAIYISYLGKTPSRDVNGQPWNRTSEHSRFAAAYAMFKAFNGRVVTSWLAHETRLAADSKNTQRLHLAAVALFHLHDWYCKVETAGRYLSTTAVWQKSEPLYC
ncbi:unnamed protein product [Symbiodinium necroappetens]|uniref:Uncharacterized protein n=1 Tax=Symbiodinium necroappetens TaxID=1628268 RepID=A0A812UEJ5_9DINO|nr:unnamed protein product [Symbiodinium necroappetens]